MEFILVLKKINNKLTAEEQVIFNDWYNQSEKHRVYFSKIEKEDSDSINYIDVEKGWEQLLLKIETVSKPKKNDYWKYVAAAIIAFLLTTPFLLEKPISNKFH